MDGGGGGWAQHLGMHEEDLVGTLLELVAWLLVAVEQITELFNGGQVKASTPSSEHYPQF